MIYVVCYSGGHSSALVAVEAVRKYGKENVILLNHNISPKVEHEDIKRFKQEVADYLGLEITYANMEGWEDTTPLEICVGRKAFKIDLSKVPCTYNLKTVPFYKWLDENYPASASNPCEEITILYGFDENEPMRIQRRAQHLGVMGYKTEFPLAYWDRTIQNIEEIGIKRPITYEIFKHANCIGCLKAGRQHWYVVYCLYPEIFKEAMDAEEEIGHSIIKGSYLNELVPKFEEMKNRGIVPSDKMKSQSFWAMVRKELKEQEGENLPCECAM
jgi:hypothetical protein